MIIDFYIYSALTDTFLTLNPVTVYSLLCVGKANENTQPNPWDCIFLVDIIDSLVFETSKLSMVTEPL